ncbi:MAG TPA: NAD(P)-binding domain-containing protein [Anaerolineaceae bacterium]
MSSPIIILGAGPYGLSAAASLCAVGAEVQVFGRPMETWKEKVPGGMRLRSSKVSSNLASVGDKLSIASYEQETGILLDENPTLAQFLAYTEWFQMKGRVDVQQTRIVSIDRENGGFTCQLEDGRRLSANRVILAPGIARFPFIPEEFRSLPKQLVTHSTEHRTFEEFQGKNVLVLGRGQSALETAAFLNECGARVEIVTRGHRLHFIKPNRSLFNTLPQARTFFYPPTDLAGPPHNWAIADPEIYRGLPKSEQLRLFDLVGPIGSGYLETMLRGVTVTAQTCIKQAWADGDKLHLVLSDGTSREVDHVFLGTGFQPDIQRCDFLSEDLRSAIDEDGGYPKLTLGYESTSVPRLHVLGALAAASLGPINRFVCGTLPVRQYLLEAVTGSRAGYPGKDSLRLVAGRRVFYRMYQIAAITW